VSDYASYDAYSHLRTVQWLIERLKETPVGADSNLWEYFLDMEVYFTEMLWRMERRGMNIDLPYLKSKIPVIQEKIDVLEKDICRLVGRHINLQSPKQLAGYFFLNDDGLRLDPVKLTKTQQPSTDEEVMNALDEAGIEVASKVVEANIVVTRHPTKISVGYSPVLQCHTIQQTVVLKKIYDAEFLSVGDFARVRLEFLSTPEAVNEGDKIVLREANTRAIGTIVKLFR